MALSRDKLQVWMHGKSFDHLTTSIGANTIALISNCLDQMAAPPTAGLLTVCYRWPMLSSRVAEASTAQSTVDLS